MSVPPPTPVAFEARLPEAGGAERVASGFEPGEGESRFCRIRDPQLRIGFDGSWNASFSARCLKRRGYGDCVCQARVSARRGSEQAFETSWKRFDVHNAVDEAWSRFEFGGQSREVRFGFRDIDVVTLTVLELEMP